MFCGHLSAGEASKTPESLRSMLGLCLRVALPMSSHKMLQGRVSGVILWAQHPHTDLLHQHTLVRALVQQALR